MREWTNRLSMPIFIGALLLILQILSGIPAYAEGTQYYYDKCSTTPAGVYSKYNSEPRNNYMMVVDTLYSPRSSGSCYTGCTVNKDTGAVQFSGSSYTSLSSNYLYSKLSRSNGEEVPGYIIYAKVNTDGFVVGTVYKIVNNQYYVQGSLINSGLVLDLSYPTNGRHTDGYWYIKTGAAISKGSVITSNIIAADGAFPNNGLHSDGFWYVRKNICETSPPIASATPTNPTNGNVSIAVSYNTNAVVKEYKINTTGTYMPYNGPITIQSNCTVFFRSKDSVGTLSLESSIVIGNIENPVLTVGTQYYYDKYSVASQGVYSKYNAQLTNNYSLVSTTCNSRGLGAPYYSSYIFDSGTGKITLSGSYSYSLSRGTYLYGLNAYGQLCYVTVDRDGFIAFGATYMPVNTPIYTKGSLISSNLILDQTYPANGRFSDGFWYVKTGTSTVKSTVISSNIIALDQSYPNDGIHTDGFWYVKKNICDMSPPIASASPTNPTNGNVTVSVTYGQNAAVKEYRIGGTGASTQYTSPIIIPSNCSVYMRSRDAVGTLSREVYIVVGNIDKTPPVVPSLNANNCNPTNGSVDVTITYSTDSTIKEYRVNSGSWTNYTAPVRISDNNSTIYARAKDSLSNTSDIGTFVVMNIDKFSPTVFASDTNSQWRPTAANVTLNYQDAGLGLTTSQFKITNSILTPDTWNSYTGPIAIGNGVWYLHYRAVDLAGNKMLGYFGPYMIDAENPHSDYTSVIYTYDNAGHLIKTDAQGALTQFMYDSSGNLLSKTCQP